MAVATKDAQVRTQDTSSTSAKGWVIDVLVGGLGGGLVGAITAVNIVVFSGIEDGYESSFGDIMDYSRFLALIVVAVLLAAPISAVFMLRKLRRSRRIPRPPMIENVST